MRLASFSRGGFVDAIMSLGNGNDFVSCLVASIQPEIFGNLFVQIRKDVNSIQREPNNLKYLKYPTAI